MKIFIYSLLVVAIGLIIYNFTFLDFQNVLNGDSGTALIGILVSSIVVVLMVILLMSRAISEKAQE
jgi:UDP-N-acetylmuramyl pentapeptide phosphotransferase/UDP-N-acetylglucosamine-1-phosphate transferase